MKASSPQAPLIDEAELVVVGAGPAGSACAARAAERGVDVALIDQSEFPRPKACGDGLTRSSVAYLHQLGLDDLVAQCHPIEGARLVIGQHTGHEKQYTPREGRPRWARCVSRSTLDQALLGAALERGARFLKGRVDQPVFEDDAATGVELLGATERSRVGARIVVAADGATSRIRRKCGFEGSRITASAIRRYVATEHELDPLFEVHVPIRFQGELAFGYGWVFPLGPKLANIGLGLAKGSGLKQPPSLRRMLASFIEELTAQERFRLGDLACIDEPVGSPLAIGFSVDRCQFANVLFTGDAARTVDPITGEGIAYALHAGEAIAELACSALRGAHAPVGAGLRLARSFPRLVQDISPVARYTVQQARSPAEPSGELEPEVAEARHQSLLDTAMRIAVTPRIDASLQSTPIVAGIQRADDAYANEIAALNDAMLDLLRTELPFASEMLHREFRAGLGPMAAATALLSHAACGGGPAAPTLKAAALACECIRLAHSLFGRISPAPATALGRANTSIAILLGDFCIAQSTKLSALAGCAAARELATVSRQMCLGRLLELEGISGHDWGPERYFAVAQKGTSPLFGLCARLGAELADAPEECVLRLSAYGQQLGLAIQLAEEIRDATADDDIAGRPQGSMLRRGRFHLSFLYALTDAPALRGRAETQYASTADDELLRISLGGIERVHDRCLDHLSAASSAIADLPGIDPSHLAHLAMTVASACDGLCGRADRTRATDVRAERLTSSERRSPVGSTQQQDPSIAVS